jgi:hypothetical protein
VCSTVGLEVVAKRKKSILVLPAVESRSSSPKPSHYTDLATVVPVLSHCEVKFACVRFTFLSGKDQSEDLGLDGGQYKRSEILNWKYLASVRNQ